jgi:cytochrome c5
MSEEVVEKRRGGGKKGQVYRKRKPYPLRCANGVEAQAKAMYSSDGTAIDANIIHKMHKKQNKGAPKCPDEKQFQT